MGINPKRRDSYKRRILKRDGDCCALCGEWMPPWDRTLDHIIEKWRGGRTTLSNLQLAHRACNNAKSNSREACAARVRWKLERWLRQAS